MKTNANYKDGILHVDIAKKEGGKKKQQKTIAIKMLGFFYQIKVSKVI
jgi:HSP20 family molecular chaperone IbpA